MGLALGAWWRALLVSSQSVEALHHLKRFRYPDYVRLKAGYAPPHWKKHGEDRTWDAGYETTAYFLEWIENRYGTGAILELNCCMKEAAYHRRLFKQITGRPVRKLWSFYCAALSGKPEPTNSLKGGDDDDDGEDD
jgi:Peptidase of plants and bacteria